MNVSLDTNIFIAGIQDAHPWCRQALDGLEQFEGTALISSMVEKEVLRNLTQPETLVFQRLLRTLGHPVDYELPPPELLVKYQQFGLKKGDLLIGAFCEFRQIDYFVSENRHFLKQFHPDAFTVVNAETFVTMITGCHPYAR